MAGTVDEIRKQTGGAQRLILRFAKEDEGRAVFEKLLFAEGISKERVSHDRSYYTVQFPKTAGEGAQFLKNLISAGVLLEECSLKSDDIEDIFLKVGAKEVA